MNVAITSGHWEVRRSKLGHPFTVWIEPVPRIPDELADSIVYLYPSEAAAQDGLQQGGSGFLCGADLSVGRLMATYVVTNKHVIRSGAMIARLNSRDGTHDILPLDGAEWFEHPDGDDIAICPVGLNFAAHRQTVFPLSQCVSEEWVKQFDIGLGDDVFMIGRFVGHEGRLQNTPSVRFGVISQTPSEPIIQEDGFGQISYLVEARSIPGYSGSPVFITIESHGPKPNLNPQLGQDLQDMVIKQIGWMKGRAGPAGFRYGPFLLGIDYCHLYDKQRIWSDETSPPRLVSKDWFVKGNSGAMGVIPAWKIKEMFEKHPKLRQHLVSVREQARRDQSTSRASQDVAGSDLPANDANPKHREDFNSLVGAAVRKPAQED